MFRIVITVIKEGELDPHQDLVNSWGQRDLYFLFNQFSLFTARRKVVVER